MITDISGFTRLTAKLSRDGGGAGAEHISEVLNTFVTRLVTLIEQQGGHVLSYEGDSVVAGWRVDPSQDLVLAAWRACYCAQVLHKRAGGYKVGSDVLTIRSGVAAGTTHLLHVMAKAETRRVILTGPAYDQVLRCTALADSGEILVSDDTWTHLDSHAEGAPTDHASVRLLTVDVPPATPSFQAPEARPPPTIDPERYLLPGLRTRLASSLSRWLGELRTITVSFIRLGEPGLIDDLPLLDRTLAGLHAEIDRFDGEILRIDICDGDLRVLVVFGLPGSAHRDDPRRAVLSALSLKSGHRQEGMRLSIGIATGEAFCGAIGAPHRAEYTVIGEAVNRGARLSATAAGRILTDDTTAAAAGDFAVFEGPWPIQVPGLRVAIRSFVALHPVEEGRRHEANELVGRATERKALDAVLDRIDEPHPRPLVIVGEAGIGKSALVETFMASCRARDVRVLYGAADDIERASPYFAFRSIIRSQLGLKDEKGADALAAISERLREREDLLRLTPLLRDLLDLGPAESAPIDQLSGSSRSDSLRRLLRDILLDPHVSTRTVMVIEDLHWIDGASRALIADLVRDPERIAIVLTTRDPAVSDDILGSEAYARLDVQPLDEQDTLELVRRSLKVADVPAATRELIWDHTGGNPFFVAELCRVIDQQQPAIRREVPAPDERAMVALPQSARAAILSRTDALPPDEQVLLKIASAAGSDFSARDLGIIDIVGAAKIDVDACIRSLLDRQLLKRAAHAPDRLALGHAIIRDVVYESMLLEHRREVHSAIARAHEAQGPLETETLPYVLSQWQRAGNRAKVFDYLDQVAELRLRQFDNAATIAHAEEFLKIAAEDHVAIPPLRRAIAHLLIGEAHVNLGRVDAALEGYENGLRLLDLPLPRTAPGLAADLVQQIFRLALRRLRRPVTAWIDTADVARSIPPDDPFLRAAKAHQHLTRIYYFRSEKARLLHATLRATNLAERYPRLTPVLAVNYASLGAICGVIPLRRQARTYLGLASRVAKRVASPATDSEVRLLTGLYETSVADWRAARQHFEAGLDDATRLGDWRRWSEIAVSLETITSPWFLTPIYAGEAPWVELVESIRSTGKRRDDLQVLGCGLVAGLRGYLVLGNTQAAGACLAELRQLVEEHSSGLEMIHRLEAAAYLAVDAFARTDDAEARDWLDRAGSYLAAINPAMKSRTLPALSAVFTAASDHAGGSDAPPVRDICGTLAKTAHAKLKHFARVYPIGRPRACLCGGDLAFARGHLPRAAHLWRRALQEAIRWEMPVDGCEALKRLRATGSPITGDDLTAASLLRRILPARASEWRELMEASRVESA